MQPTLGPVLARQPAGGQQERAQTEQLALKLKTVMILGSAMVCVLVLFLHGPDQRSQMRLNGDISGSPVTFTVNGKQYVAVGRGPYRSDCVAESTLPRERSGGKWHDVGLRAPRLPTDDDPGSS
jgi:hypothetical protein